MNIKICAEIIFMILLFFEPASDRMTLDGNICTIPAVSIIIKLKDLPVWESITKLNSAQSLWKETDISDVFNDFHLTGGSAHLKSL